MIAKAPTLNNLMTNALDAITTEAWLEYQETGVHVTYAEVELWLASWGAENELPAPKCHK